MGDGTPGFTAHNIRFPDGTVTMPGHPRLLADEPWCAGAKRVLSLVYGGDPRGRRVADLGCLEGGYALEFARMGMHALGVEVRASNFANCAGVGRRAGLPNLSFVQDDVWNLAAHGPFDAIFCCGLLYHLDRPRAFVRLMGEQARDAVIVNTHFAPWDWEPEPVFALSALEEHEGLPGRWYFEHDAEDEAALERLRWASWSNRRSFWPVREALLHCLREAGFDLVFQQFDAAGDDVLGATTDAAVRAHCRGVFVGIRTPAARRTRGHPISWLAELFAGERRQRS
jgi:SAM-dependent methyltransferase